MNTETQAVKVGVGVFIYRQGKVLLGERIGAHGAETWALPGGHLEVGETPQYCAKREVLEETGLIINDFDELGFTNDIFEEDRKHYITLFLKARSDHGTPTVLEPLKCKQWQWFEMSKLPTPLFLPLSNYLKKYT